MRNRYVYLHLAVKPREKGQVFYVGAGTYQKKGRYLRMNSDVGRNDYWKSTVEEYGIDRVVFSDNLTADEAYQLEKDLIHTFQGDVNSGVMYLTNLTSGGRVGWSWNKDSLKKMSKTKTGKIKSKRKSNVNEKGVSVRRNERGVDFQPTINSKQYKVKLMTVEEANALSLFFYQGVEFMSPEELISEWKDNYKGLDRDSYLTFIEIFKKKV